MKTDILPTPEFSDPIIHLIEEYGDLAMTDPLVSHLSGLSDVIKNNMMNNLNWGENSINSKLWGIINSGLDENGRYRERPIEVAADEPLKKYSGRYVEAQCLMTEWMAIYRTIRVHCSISRRRAAA